MNFFESLIPFLKTLFNLYKYDLVVFDKWVGWKYGLYNRKYNKFEVKGDSLDEIYMLSNLKLGITKTDIDHWDLHNNFFDIRKSLING